jgi:hypothetical protein
VLTATATSPLLWSTGETTSPITVTTAGVITATQSANGCTSPVASITAAPKVIPAAPTVTVSNGCGATVLTATTTGTLHWSTNATSTSINVTNAGNYTVYQTVNGCLSDTTTVTAAPLTIPTVTLAPLSDVCINTPAFTLTGGSPTGGTYSGTAVSANQFTPLTAGYGNFPITYTYTASNGCSSTAQQSIQVGCAGIEETENFAFVVYPNPTTGIFAINTNAKFISGVKMYDVSGKLIQDFNYSIQPSLIEVDMRNVADGLYTIELYSANGNSRARVIKTH